MPYRRSRSRTACPLCMSKACISSRRDDRERHSPRPDSTRRPKSLLRRPAPRRGHPDRIVAAQQHPPPPRELRGGGRRPRADLDGRSLPNGWGLEAMWRAEQQACEGGGLSRNSGHGAIAWCWAVGRGGVRAWLGSAALGWSVECVSGWEVVRSAELELGALNSTGPWAGACTQARELRWQVLVLLLVLPLLRLLRAVFHRFRRLRSAGCLPFSTKICAAGLASPCLLVAHMPRPKNGASAGAPD